MSTDKKQDSIVRWKTADRVPTPKNLEFVSFDEILERERKDATKPEKKGFILDETEWFEKMQFTPKLVPSDTDDRNKKKKRKHKCRGKNLLD